MSRQLLYQTASALKVQKEYRTLGISGQMKLLGSRVTVWLRRPGRMDNRTCQSRSGRDSHGRSDVFDETQPSAVFDRGQLRHTKALRRQQSRCMNGAVETFPVVEFLDENNGRRILEGAAIAIDALDNNKGRRTRMRHAAASIPFVHGAIGGMFGQVGSFTRATYHCGITTMSLTSVETVTGNPPFTLPCGFP